MSIVDKEQNVFFKDLGNLMKTDEFRHFYQTHMRTNLELKTSILYIELYATVEELYKKYTGKNIPDAEMEVFLKECIRRKNYRQPLVSLIQTYFDKGTPRTKLTASLENIFRANLLEEGTISLAGKKI